MKLFTAVKNMVTAREAAEFYGIRVNRSGMARCPFHYDTKPSLKLDKRFHCFGCGADGNVIQFTAKLFRISEKEAAKKLAADFQVIYKDWKPPDIKTRRKKRKQKNRETRYEANEKKFCRVLADYYYMMKEWKKERAPKSPEEEWDDRFCEALLNLPKTEYVLDCFLEGSLEERIDIMNEYGEKVKEYERKLRQYRSEKAGTAGCDNGPD
ncbi:MAG: DNA primase [Parasporobacterium sp.]|nr:DNA primase [Parasporobacterium sp.]